MSHALTSLLTQLRVHHHDNLLCAHPAAPLSPLLSAIILWPSSSAGHAQLSTSSSPAKYRWGEIHNHTSQFCFEWDHSTAWKLCCYIKPILTFTVFHILTSLKSGGNLQSTSTPVIKMAVVM